MARIKGKVAVAMSGGVDSSVAAFLLREAGYAVAGFTMTREDADGREGKVSEREVEDAKKVCDFLGLEHFSVDVAGVLERHVINPFIQEYLAGRTPNPCVKCNRFVKFGFLLEEIAKRGFDFLATGHYARIQCEKGKPVLMKGVDVGKDQSYFLHAIEREHLAHVLFPLGELTKKVVRKIAHEHRIPSAGKAESQDVCFIPESGYGEFLRKRGFEIEPGNFVDREGRILGQHRGSLLYTIGQRARLGGSNMGRLYVTQINPRDNLVFLGSKEELQSRGLVADQVNLLVDELPVRCEAKIRYAHQPAACEVKWEGERLNVKFDIPQEAITPGQFLVLYGGEIVFGGGRIINTER